MKIYHILTVFIVINLFFSCSNDETTNDQPEIPSSIELYINNDDKVDYIIEYNKGLILSPTSDEIINGYFNPTGENLVLHKMQAKNLFLRNLNEIDENVADPLFWNNSGWTEKIVSIRNNIDGTWPIQWTAHSENEQSSYFIGLKLIDNNVTELGWIELSFNLDNGKISILDKGIF